MGRSWSHQNIQIQIVLDLMMIINHGPKVHEIMPVYTFSLLPLSIYCHVPARCGLQQTTLAPGSDETRARDPFYINT